MDGPSNLPEKYFLQENAFVAYVYFICSAGSASEDMLRKYIKSQG
jgi:REP element-mobilizing transposase RayT